jgi:hypothetical protein
VRAAAASDVDLSDAEFTAIRNLLEHESTWVLVGGGTVEKLAARIASCLPGRAEEVSLASGRAIAAGLLEFAVRDLEPELFPRVLFAQLDRKLVKTTTGLNPTIADLGGLADWPVPPSPALLAATRRNSELSAWLPALPLFPGISGTAAASTGTDEDQQ